MRKPRTVRSAETLGRVRLSRSFFMRDFLYSEIANVHGMTNLPDDPDLATAAGRGLCEHLLEPLQATLGRLAIRSAYRAPGGERLRQRAFPELRLERTRSRAPYLGSAQRRWRHGRDDLPGHSLAGRPP